VIFFFVAELFNQDLSRTNVMGAKFVGWRYGVLIGGIVGSILLAIYPIGIHPYMYPEKWQQIQKETRMGVRQEDIQPGGMKVWSDPFNRTK